MRVALDASALVGPGTGITTYVHALRSGLDRTDAVEVVPFTISARATLHRTAVGRAIPAPAELLHRLWVRGDRPRFDRWWPGADVLHGTNFVVPPSRVPRVATVHDLSFLHFPEDAPPSVQRFDELVRRQVDSGVTIHCVSEFVAEEVRDVYGAELVDVVASGAPAAIDHAAWGDIRRGASTPAILLLGTTMTRKRVSWFVGVFEELAASRPDLELWIAGPAGPDEPALDTAVAALSPDVRRRVRRRGRVTDDERRSLLCRASVLAVPSAYEGFGLPVLEAMAHRLPVVATAGSALPEAAGGAAQMVGEASIDAWAERLGAVLDADDEAERLRRAGLDRVASRPWAATVADHVDMYRRIAERHLS